MAEKHLKKDEDRREPVFEHGHDEAGLELVNPVPYAATVNRPKKELTTMDIVNQAITSREFARLREAQGEESFEEANDFNIEDPFEVDLGKTAYEIQGMDVDEMYEYISPHLPDTPPAESGEPGGPLASSVGPSDLPITGVDLPENNDRREDTEQMDLIRDTDLKRDYR